ncbi:MAG: 3-hydroxyacyl-[acyl-carrier-protein] dehydratase FabZ [Rhodobacteraceae bacterium]|nr:MAG: 3-hydroxyacyl-[acyl-carrier-protein] dehydratase FabZ [Paracoccaceae bacterium]|tara:strand:- start:42 stop:506 length:465 start_codon:yes stop_codon:yes gene_type:complete
MAASDDRSGVTINLNEIKRMIPHRYPFLMIDKVIDLTEGVSATGIKNVTCNEPHFPGHFPEQPIMPGVLIVEAMAQTAAVLVAKSLGLVDHNFLVYFLSIDRAKFRKPVEPGDVLNLVVNVVRNRGKTWKFSGRAMVGKNLVTESDFTAMMVEQ